jgi:hypothetical protein
MTGLFAANLLVTKMIGELNRKRGDDEVVPYFGFTPFKLARVFDAYRQEYPSGRTHRHIALALTMFVIGLLATGACLAIAGRQIGGPVGRDAVPGSRQTSGAVSPTRRSDLPQWAAHYSRGGGALRSIEDAT